MLHDDRSAANDLYTQSNGHFYGTALAPIPLREHDFIEETQHNRPYGANYIIDINQPTVAVQKKVVKKKKGGSYKASKHKMDVDEVIVNNNANQQVTMRGVKQVMECRPNSLDDVSSIRELTQAIQSLEHSILAGHITPSVRKRKSSEKVANDIVRKTKVCITLIYISKYRHTLNSTKFN